MRRAGGAYTRRRSLAARNPDRIAPRVLLFLAALAFATGAHLASFAALAIHRSGRGLFEPSRCDECGLTLKPLDRQPVVGFVVRKGRARCCGGRIDGSHLMAELLGGALALVAFMLIFT